MEVIGTVERWKVVVWVFVGQSPSWIFLRSFSTKAALLHLFSPLTAGGRLFSKLHKLRKDRAKEHPECLSSGQHNGKLKTSFTSPTIRSDYEQAADGGKPGNPARFNDESPDSDFSTSWAATQQQLESCGTHSYIEETGCLQNSRSRQPLHKKLDRLTLFSGSTRTHSNSYIRPPAASLCLHAGETQENPALPLSCSRISQALNAMSGLDTKQTGMGLTECSSKFEVAWKAVDPLEGCEKIYPYAVTGSPMKSTPSQTAPQTSQTSFLKAPSGSDALSSSPAILHLPLHSQTQIRGRACWDSSDSHQGPGLCRSPAENIGDSKPDSSSSPTAEERNGVIVIRSTDRAVFSEHTEGENILEGGQTSAPPFCHKSAERQWKFPGVSMSLMGLKTKEETGSSDTKEAEEEIRGSSPREKSPPADGRSFASWISSGVSSLKGKDASKSEKAAEGDGDDQIIEVDGWCHLPRLTVKSSATEKATQACWGLPEGEVRVWGAQILLALESLHQQGVLCRDLNPRNVLLTSNGEFAHHSVLVLATCIAFFWGGFNPMLRMQERFV